MPEQEDPFFERMKRTMDFILEQQAKMAVHLAKAEERAREGSGQHNREMAQIRNTLRRAVRLGVQEARNQRKRRHDLEARARALEAQSKESEARTQVLETRADESEAWFKRMKEESEARFQRIELLNADSTEKLNALIHIVDEWIRRGRPSGA
jgi:hypothetical protein